MVNNSYCPNAECNVDYVGGNFCPECGTKTEEKGIAKTNSPVKEAPKQVTSKENRKLKKPIKNVVNLETSSNPIIKVQFYETMPGRVSLSNNKSYVHGIMELANNEIIIHKKSFWRGKERGTKHIRYDKITSIDYDKAKFLSPAAIQIYLSSVEYSFTSHDKRLESFYEKIRKKFDEVQNQETNTESNLSPLDELKKLNELREIGVVTEEEFELKKKQLLNL